MPEKVHLIGSEILRKRCVPVDLAVVPIEAMLDRMHETMKAEGGIGLAANQIGDPFCIFILKEGDSYREYINPEILSQSDLVDFEGEGCLSIPGASATTKRFKNLRLTWMDKGGVKREEEFTDLTAFAVQHEMDHLKGKLYVDQLGPLRRDLTLSKHRKFLRGR